MKGQAQSRTGCGCGGSCASCAGTQAAAKPQVSPFATMVQEVVRPGGTPLPAATRRTMESHFRADLSQVRVHSGGRAAESARAVGARAYTVGRDIVFNTGEYQPRTPRGQHLLAHELAHTLQDGVSSRVHPKLEVDSVNSRSEREASAAADALGTSRPFTLTRLARPALHRNCFGGASEYSVIGVRAHLIIQGWCASQYPGCRPEVPIPGSAPGGGVGRADLLRERGNEVEIGEIKPITQSGASRVMGGVEQIARYMEMYQQQNPGKRVVPMRWRPRTPPNGTTPLPGAGRAQYLTVTEPNMAGMYYYYCTRSRRQRRRAPRRVGERREVRERFRRLVERLQELRRPIVQPQPVTRSIDWGRVLGTALILAGIVLLVIAAAPLIAAAGTAIAAGMAALGKVAVGATALVLLAAGLAAATSSTAHAATPGGSGASGESGTTSEGTTSEGAEGNAPAGAAPEGEIGEEQAEAAAGADNDAIVDAVVGTEPEQLASLPPEQMSQARQHATTVTSGAQQISGVPNAGEIRAAAAETNATLRSAQEGGGSRAGGAPAPAGVTPGTAGAGMQQGAQGGGAGPAPPLPGAPETVTATAEIPAAGTRTEFPIIIVSGLTRRTPPGSVRTVTLRVNVDPPFVVEGVRLRVGSVQGRVMNLTVEQPWYVTSRNLGSPRGARYTYEW